MGVEGLMQIRARESVILAEDYEGLVAWYQAALGFRVLQQFSEGYSYANLATETGIQIGIGSLKEMGNEAPNRGTNTVLLQVEVDDVAAFFEHLAAHAGEVLFGPSFDEKGGFWFGGFADPEGNPWWVVDKNCP